MLSVCACNGAQALRPAKQTFFHRAPTTAPGHLMDPRDVLAILQQLF